MTFADFRAKVWAIVSQHWHVLAAFLAGWVVGKGWLGRLL